MKAPLEDEKDQINNRNQIMRGINKVILVGTLGAEPDVKYAANGNTIANLSVATSDEWNDKNTGQKQQKTEWHRVVIFGKLAEIAQQYLHKGSQVYLEGKLQTRKWQDQQGQDKYTTEIVLSGFEGSMQMLGGSQKNDSNSPGVITETSVTEVMGGADTTKSSNKPRNSFSDFDDIDIPF